MGEILDSSLGDETVVISRLFVYPVKSCGGVELDEVLLTETGLEFDRAWMVVDENGRFVTQRQFPRMALIKPKLRQSDMVLRAPGMLALHIELNAVEKPVKVTVWKDEVEAYDMGDMAARWFSMFLCPPESGKPERNLRLVRFNPDFQRYSSERWTGDVKAPNQFSDGYAVLVISQSALDSLNDRLVERGAEKVGMDRFRPNIVVESFPGESMAPHAEDHWHELNIATGQGIATLRMVKPCPRCEIPNIDQSTAERQTEPNATLAGYRGGDSRLDGAVSFGMNSVVMKGVDFLLKKGAKAGATIAF